MRSISSFFSQSGTTDDDKQGQTKLNRQAQMAYYALHDNQNVSEVFYGKLCIWPEIRDLHVLDNAHCELRANHQNPEEHLLEFLNNNNISYQRTTFMEPIPERAQSYYCKQKIAINISKVALIDLYLEQNYTEIDYRGCGTPGDRARAINELSRARAEALMQENPVESEELATTAAII